MQLFLSFVHQLSLIASSLFMSYTMCYGGSKITSKIFVYDPSSTLVLLWSGASSVQTSIIILILVCQLSFIIDRKAEESRKLSDKYLVYCQFLSSLIFVWHRKTRRVKTTLRQISSYLPVLIVSHLCLTGRKERRNTMQLSYKYILVYPVLVFVSPGAKRVKKTLRRNSYLPCSSRRLSSSFDLQTTPIR